MSDPDPVHSVQQVKFKVMRLLAEKDLLLKQVETLLRDNELLVNEVRQQKNTIQTLQTQNKMVKLAEMLPSDAGDRQELKKMLRDYIRQIDDCIRLLSE